MRRKAWHTALRTLLSFSKREQLRLLLLLPLLLLLAALFARVDRPSFEQSFTRVADRVADSLQHNRYAHSAERTPSLTADSTSLQDHISSRTHSQELFRFDPNKVSLEELERLGFSPKQAQGILNYRNAGGHFHRPEDFARCYTVSAQQFHRLRPYIYIANAPQSISSVTNHASSHPSGAASSASASNAETLSTEQPLNPSTKKVVTKRSLTPSIDVELNEADSAALIAIRGIGSLTAMRILRYRKALGGFANVTQLREIAGMTDENYALILQQIWVDSSKIQKIDINFADPKRIQGHPYLPSKVLNRILKYRQLKGGWSNTTELIEQHIVSPQQAERLSAYLDFRTK